MGEATWDNPVLEAGKHCQLQVGDVFTIANPGTPWFAQGWFKVTSIVTGKVNLERVAGPDDDKATIKRAPAP